MTIGQLKALIPAYLGESAANLTVGGVDLMLMALNNARIQAELAHDFVEQDVFCRLSVSSSGGALSAAVLESTGATTQNIKTVKQCYLRDTTVSPAGYIPLFFERKKTAASRILDIQNAYEVDWMEGRYRDDNINRLGLDSMRVYQDGATLFINPSQTSTVTLALDTNVWMTAYTADADTDWMTVRGYTYLMWAAICELNKMTKTFVVRQEGFLSPPEKERDAALNALIEWDNTRSEFVMEGIR